MTFGGISFGDAVERYLSIESKDPKLVEELGSIGLNQYGAFDSHNRNILELRVAHLLFIFDFFKGLQHQLLYIGAHDSPKCH